MAGVPPTEAAMKALSKAKVLGHVACEMVVFVFIPLHPHWVFPKIGKNPQMDGENNGKPLLKYG